MLETVTSRHGMASERYASIIWAACRRYRLSGADTEDVGQAVWLSW